MWKEKNHNVEIKIHSIHPDKIETTFWNEGRRCPVYVLDSKLAQKFTAYYTAMADLGNSYEMIKKISEIKNSDDKIILNALWRSGVLYYTRCFSDSTKGRRINLQDFAKFEESEKKLENIHKSIMSLRNNYIAHAGDAPTHNQFYCALVLDPNQKQIVNSIPFVFNRQDHNNEELLNDFLKLIQLMHEKVQHKLQQMFIPLKKEIDQKPVEYYYLNANKNFNEPYNL